MPEGAVGSWDSKPSAVTGPWFCYRQTSPDLTALYADARVEAPSQDSGHWNDLGVNFAQYMSLQPMGSWAELARHENIRKGQQAETVRKLWLLYVADERVADLSSFDHYESCGLDPEMAVSSEYSRTHLLRYELEDAGFSGVLSPSAAHSTAINLTLFGERRAREVSGSLEAWPNHFPSDWIPAQLLADNAPLPAVVLDQAVYLDETHPSYFAWRSSRP